MAADTESLAPEAGEPPTEGTPRRERREDAVHIVEYTPFPRASAAQTPRIGFTRDLSPSGMCLGVDVGEPDGALLRVVLRDLDGRTLSAAIARVAWTSPARDGRRWLGLDLINTRSRSAAAEPM